ncbi:MAG: leucyl/phenylalanyl-tRNA--protein transferase [Bacteroidales bacterium]|nr:leucyl/phenylalanyl-tRNA--protein transferase [Bacteroidales bacterium]
MPYHYVFPEPEMADKDGFIAAGGDLSVESLISAYSSGIFPWYSEGSPILWWSPDPRLVLYPDKLKLSSSLKHTIRRRRFTVLFDNDFTAVINNCASIKRKSQEGTWITGDMQQAYIRLHHQGYAHSVETYFEGKLAGGLYGVSLGKAFFGESMFHRVSDASKIALYYLVEQIKQWDFHFIDAQQSTNHLRRLGAEEIPRKEFLLQLRRALEYPTRRGKWKMKEDNR